MKYLVKTDNSGTLEEVDYTRVIWDTTDDNVLIQNTIGGGGVSSDYVDLGLPSGLLWAKKNLGAETEEDVGLYFQWGDTQGYTAEQVGMNKDFISDDYKFSTGESYSDYSKYNSTDGKTVLDLEDDAVNAMMGGNWRMPTKEDFHELINNTDLYIVPAEGNEIKGNTKDCSGTSAGLLSCFEFEKESTVSIKGMKFYKKGDSSICMFIPASGFVAYGSSQSVGVGMMLTSSISLQNDNFCCNLTFDDFDGGIAQSMHRYFGFPIRGVCSK